jgi:hypothetical protein
VLYAVVFGCLLAANWLATGSVSPVAPQAIANQAYRELWSGNIGAAQSAVAKFRQALSMDPAFPYRWSDLGQALAEAGQTESARRCFQRSLDLAPNSPQIMLRAANFYLQKGEVGPALRLEASILRLTSEYDNMVFSSWVRLAGDQTGILQTGIGTNARAARSFFRFLTGSGATSRLDTTWKWMEDRSYAGVPEAKMWASWLIGRQRDSEAFAVWKRHISRDPAFGVTQWIDNSGFGGDASGQGFDWRIQNAPGMKTSLDAAVTHSSRPSLRIDFDGSRNLDFISANKRVWLPPGSYLLTAWIRTSNLSTDRGLALTLLGVSTAPETGTHDWNLVRATVSVKGQPSAGEVQLVRQKSWKFDGNIQGTAWVDDVELRPVRN